MSELKIGDKVKYLPDLSHWHEEGPGRSALFEFVWARDEPARGPDTVSAKAGDVYADVRKLLDDKGLKLVQVPGQPELCLMRSDEQTCVKVSRPLFAWDAVVSEEVTHEHGEPVLATIAGVDQLVRPIKETRRLVLDVRHPNGVVTLHLPLETVAHDPSGKTPHSYCTIEEAV